MAREKFPSDDVDRMMVRFPAGLRDRLKAEAEANKRSMNAEIVARLDQSLSEGKRITPDESFAFADGAMIGMLQALEILSKDGMFNLSGFIKTAKEGSDLRLRSMNYDKSVVAEMLRTIGFSDSE